MSSHTGIWEEKAVYQWWFRFSAEKVCHCKLVRVTNFGLSKLWVNRIINENKQHPWFSHTDWESYKTWSFLLDARRSSYFFLVSSLYSLSWSSSFACCFLSISERFLCAGVEELWDSVPSRAPKSLRPRFRSSSLPGLGLSAAFTSLEPFNRWVFEELGGVDWFARSENPSALSRLLLLLLLLEMLCLRFGRASRPGYCGGSGSATADAIELCLYISKLARNDKSSPRTWHLPLCHVYSVIALMRSVT